MNVTQIVNTPRNPVNWPRKTEKSEFGWGLSPKVVPLWSKQWKCSLGHQTVLGLESILCSFQEWNNRNLYSLKNRPWNYETKPHKDISHVPCMALPCAFGICPPRVTCLWTALPGHLNGRKDNVEKWGPLATGEIHFGNGSWTWCSYWDSWWCLLKSICGNFHGIITRLLWWCPGRIWLPRYATVYSKHLQSWSFVFNSVNKEGIRDIWMKSSSVYSECNLGPSQIHKRTLPQPLPENYWAQLGTSQALRADHMPCQRCWGGCCTDHLWLGLWRGKCRIWDQRTTNGKQWTAWNFVEYNIRN